MTTAVHKRQEELDTEVHCSLNLYRWVSVMAECLENENIAVDDNPNVQATIPCDDCEDTEDVFSYCLDCPGALCENCKDSHRRRKMTRSHTVVPYDDPKVEISKNIASDWQCEKHSGNAIVARCEDCGQPCCYFCVATDHKGHEILGVVDKMCDAKNKIEQFIEAHEIAIETLSDDIRKMELEIQKEMSNAQTAENKIDEVLKYMHKAVDSEGSKLREKIKKQADKNIVFLRNKISQRQNERFPSEKLVTESRDILKASPKLLLTQEFLQEKSTPPKYDMIPRRLPSVLRYTETLGVKELAAKIGGINLNIYNSRGLFGTFPGRTCNLGGGSSRKRISEKMTPCPTVNLDEA